MRPAITHSRLNAVLPTMLVILSATLLFAKAVSAQEIGGHIGFVLPTVSHQDGVTSDLTDNFSIAFPMGITVKGKGKLAFDFELVAAVENGPLAVDLTVHPGLIYAATDRVALGLRAAFDIGQPSVGFTPLVARSFPMMNGTALFAEFDLPVRFKEDESGRSYRSIGLGLHFGIGF